ncbi:MAG: penicillin-binding protein [Lachnospiraceae bacterium]|nr:penicillin-binding protein [Lachnospiraceae bacterium]
MKKLKNSLKSFFNNRVSVLIVVMAVLFSILVVHLFNLQIIRGNEYKQSLNSSIEKVISTPASRGRIFDRNGVLLAYDDIVYAVNISDSGSFKNKTEKNEAINNSIIKTLAILSKNGDKYTNTFGISYENGKYEYNVEGNTRLGFLRDCYGKAAISDLTDEQKNSSADELMKYMITNYQINTDKLSPDDLLELLYLRMNLTANSYTRYKPITIASEISEASIAAISENQNTFTGVTVDSQYVRRYNDSKYYSALMGYTGVVSTDQLDELRKENSSYDNTDLVGKGGIEEAFEMDLAGKKGEKQVYLDTVGRITEVIGETQSVAGHDVYLTIDSRLQKKLYDLLEEKLTEIVLAHLKESGEKYVYDSGGALIDLYILMPEVYFALIDNDLVSFDKLRNPTTDLEKSVNGRYEERLKEKTDWLSGELNGQGTNYKDLSDENKSYIWRAYEILTENKIIRTDLMNNEDPVTVKWNSGEDISFKAFIEHCITNGWVDLSEISDSQYTDLSEVYSKITSYITEKVKEDRKFCLNIFKYLIQDGTVSGREMCMLLYDQGYLQKDDYYNSLSNWTLSASDFIRTAMNNKLLTPGTLGIAPSSSAAVLEDPNNGQLLALVSYPGYDTNKLSGNMDVDYYNQISKNASKPLLNWATQAQTMPGSTFKMATALAGLNNGIIDPYTQIYCSGLFTEVTPSPRCSVYPGEHGNETVQTALRDSCNVFFYSIGYDLAKSKDGSYDSDYGTDILKKYTDDLGLSVKSGIEIPESTPKASDTNAIASAIGQGTAQYSCLNLSRYVSTIANGGKSYETHLVLKVTDNSGKTIKETNSVLSNEMNYISDTAWKAVHDGMILAVQHYKTFSGLESLKVAGKTGTSQINKTTMDNGTFVSYAPYDNPEIALSIETPNGYTSTYNAQSAAAFYEWYFKDFKNGANN